MLDYNLVLNELYDKGRITRRKVRELLSCGDLRAERIIEDLLELGVVGDYKHPIGYKLLKRL